MPRTGGMGDAVCRKSKIATELSQFCRLFRESTEELKSSHPYLRIKIRVLFEAEGRGKASVLTFTVSSLSTLAHKRSENICTDLPTILYKISLQLSCPIDLKFTLEL